MLKEQQARQSAAAAELKAIADQKALASATLVDLRTSIDRALAIVAPDDKTPAPALAPMNPRRPPRHGVGGAGGGTTMSRTCCGR